MTAPTSPAAQVASVASFFRMHLPRTGHICIANHADGRFSPSFCSDAEKAAARAITLDAGRRGQVYFGCAVYADPASGRKGHNVAAARSLWLDIDTREWKDDAPYADRPAAKLALAKFCCEIGLPDPTVVDSGNGLHVYWPLDRDLKPAEWRGLAQLLKLATLRSGLVIVPDRLLCTAGELRCHAASGIALIVLGLRDLPVPAAEVTTKAETSADRGAQSSGACHSRLLIGRA
ncbi:hypothetical protein GRI75_06220 [Altererythrobacter soli]|uniref:Uncharacterized protein n=1 Tax=Croceibacterium soli TaxID=1739690 RepID=A0A6I4UUS5_9SPHN|nr:hypothetical protein [Croceibacterium soli]MXP41237.1 hypothetical protein [Croceibacterium soli]